VTEGRLLDEGPRTPDKTCSARCAKPRTGPRDSTGNPGSRAASPTAPAARQKKTAPPGRRRRTPGSTAAVSRTRAAASASRISIGAPWPSSVPPPPGNADGGPQVATDIDDCRDGSPSAADLCVTPHKHDGTCVDPAFHDEISLYNVSHRNRLRPKGGHGWGDYVVRNSALAGWARRSASNARISGAIALYATLRRGGTGVDRARRPLVAKRPDVMSPPSSEESSTRCPGGRPDVPANLAVLAE